MTISSIDVFSTRIVRISFMFLSIDIFFVQSVKSGRLLVENADNKITEQQNNKSTFLSIDIFFPDNESAEPAEEK